MDEYDVMLHSGRKASFWAWFLFREGGFVYCCLGEVVGF